MRTTSSDRLASRPIGRRAVRCDCAVPGGGLARRCGRRAVRCDCAVPGGGAAAMRATTCPMRLCSSGRWAAADAGDDLSDATAQFRAVGRGRCGRRPVRCDCAVPGDQPAGRPDYAVPRDQPAGLRPGPRHGDQGHAELRSLIHSILAGLKPREREVIELIFRHDLHEDDLTMTLGVSQSRAQALASRARARLEEALGTLHIALTGREACPVLGELLADWDGQLTEQTRDLVVWHIEDCQTCAQHGWGAMRPAAFSRLLPLAPLPPELREQVLSLCTSTAADAVAYRRRVTRHAERIWFARFSRAIGRVSWNSIRPIPERLSPPWPSRCGSWRPCAPRCSPSLAPMPHMPRRPRLASGPTRGVLRPR